MNSRRVFAQAILIMMCGIGIGFFGIVHANHLAAALGSILLFISAFVAALTISRKQS